MKLDWGSIVPLKPADPGLMISSWEKLPLELYIDKSIGLYIFDPVAEYIDLIRKSTDITEGTVAGTPSAMKKVTSAAARSVIPSSSGHVDPHADTVVGPSTGSAKPAILRTGTASNLGIPAAQPKTTSPIPNTPGHQLAASQALSAYHAHNYHAKIHDASPTAQKEAAAHRTSYEQHQDTINKLTSEGHVATPQHHKDLYDYAMKTKQHQLGRVHADYLTKQGMRPRTGEPYHPPTPLKPAGSASRLYSGETPLTEKFTGETAVKKSMQYSLHLLDQMMKAAR